mgnify:CR=1 FL=1
MDSIKNCPFNKTQCNTDCALFIDPAELNETVKNKLASIGIISRTSGVCSFKLISLCMGRFIFENTNIGYFREK